jgi:hypothetical protein
MDVLIDFFTGSDKVEHILEAVFAVMTAAKLIVNLTPTPADDAAFTKVYKVVELVAGIWTKKAKQ